MVLKTDEPTVFTTDQPREQQHEIEAQLRRELEDILGMLQDIRRRTGFGKILIVVRYGEIHDVEFTFSRKPKHERRQEKP